MCGIFGFWLNRPLTEVDIELGRRCTRDLQHRGPDGDGEWVDRQNGMYFGHRRLAIIDLSDSSSQPMQRGELCLTYNGEIYNYLELREQLQARGQTFQTSGDTEVLLSAWQEWGTASLDRFDGMFAFALTDGRELVLATDPFGEKPLYCARRADGVFFSSEPEVLIRALGLIFHPTRDEVLAFLSLGFIPHSGTGFAGLEVLPPATLRRYTDTRKFSETRYWRPPAANIGEGACAPLSDAAVDDIGNQLVDSLRLRLRADVPVGLFLSSGIDSSLIAALASKELHLPLQTLTVSFADGVDESSAAAGIAAALQLPHKVIASSPRESTADAPAELAALYGLPVDNLTSLSVVQMSAAARQHVTVALNGVGGDELFYGYNKYEFLQQQRVLYRLPPALLRPWRGLADVSVLPGRVRAALSMLAQDRVGRFLAVKNGRGAALLARGGLLPTVLPDFGAEGVDLVHAARDFDLNQTMPDNYIPAIERGSMRVGLEVRSPFLSRRLTEAVAGHDARALIAYGRKSVLRRLLRRYLPESLIDRGKRGFVYPLARYLSGRIAAPQVAGLPQTTLDAIWAERGSAGVAGIALRAAVLEHFHRRVP